MVVDLRQRQLFAQPVALPLVAGAVDRLREQERIVQPIELLANRLHPPVLLGRAVLRLGLPLLPRVENPVLDQAHVTGGRLPEREFVRERTFEGSLADVDRSALALAVVVGVVAVPALRPAARQRSPTGLAPDEAAQREVGMAALAGASNDDAAIENSLRAEERRLVHEGLEVPARRDAVIRTLDLSDVDRVPHHLAEALGRDAERLPAAKSCLGRARDHFLFRVAAGRQFLERPSNQRTALWVVNQARVRPLRCVQISKRRRERPAAKFQRGTHAGARPFRADVVVELRERRKHAFHQLAGRRVVDRLGHRSQRDAERLQVGAEREVVVLLAREACEVVHDKEVDLALVGAAELQQRLELAAVGGLGALAFLVEAFEHFVALPAAIVFAGAELRRKTQVLRLLLRADAYEITAPTMSASLAPSPGVGTPRCRGIGVSGCDRPARQDEQDVRHRICVPHDVAYVIVRKRVGLMAEHLAASLNRHRFRAGVHAF